MTDNTTSAPHVEDTTTDHEQDVAAIRQVIADVETAFNTNDPDLMTAHFARNATVVNAVGTRTTGWDALLDAHRTALTGFLRDEYAHYDVTDVVFLRPDVAIAHKNARATTSDGELVDTDPSMTALYVLVKERNRWWITARQNTLTR